MSKPDWKDAPEWANWLALDASGDWGWYGDEPWIVEESKIWAWPCPLYGDWKLAGFSESHDAGWKETLESRP